ncbi:helix-turn-helix domain-containing protein, partial [Vibrio anguillarum]
MNIIDGPNQDFALRLCDLRRKAGVTQEELANSIGTDKRSISTYENGRTFPREETLRRLALYFDVDAYWLSTGHS